MINQNLDEGASPLTLTKGDEVEPVPLEFPGGLFRREVRFVGCHFSKADLSRATFYKSVTFERCEFWGDVDFGHLRVRGTLSLKDCTIHACREEALIDMHAMRISGELSLSGTVVRRDLLLNGSRLMGGFRYRARLGEDGEFHGECANLKGEDLEVHREFDIGGLSVRGDLILGRGSFDTSLRMVWEPYLGEKHRSGPATRIEGQCDLHEVRVSGGLSLSESEPGISIGGTVDLTDARIDGDVRARNARFAAGLRLRNAVIGGSLICDWYSATTMGRQIGSVHFDNAPKPRLSVWGSDMSVNGSIHFTGREFESGIDLARARVQGNLFLDAVGSPGSPVRLPCRVGPAHTELTGAFNIMLTGAEIHGTLYAGGLQTTRDPSSDAEKTPSLLASGLVCHAVNLETRADDWIKETPRTEIDGYVDLSAAKLFVLRMRGAKVGGLNLESCDIDGDVLAGARDGLPADIGIFETHGNRQSILLFASKVRGFVNLRGACLSGSLFANYADLAALDLGCYEDEKGPLSTHVACGTRQSDYEYAVSFENTVIRGRFVGQRGVFGGPLDGAGSRIMGDFDLSDATVHGGHAYNRFWGTSEMGVWLRQAKIDGQCVIRGTKFLPGKTYYDGRLAGSALCLWDATVGGIVSLERTEIGLCEYMLNGSDVPGGHYSVDARGAQISGSMILDSARTESVIDLSEAHLEGLQIRGSQVGGVDLRSGKIQGDLIADAGTRVGAFQRRRLCTSLNLVAAKVSGVVDLRGGYFESAINADFASLQAGFLVSNGAEGDDRLRTFVGPAEHEDRFWYSLCFNAAEITGNVVARYATLHGSVDGAGAHVRGDLDFTGATIIGGQVSNDIWPAESGFWMRRAHIEGQLLLRKARIYGSVGAASDALPPPEDGDDVKTIPQGAAVCLLDVVIDGIADLDEAVVGRAVLKPAREYDWGQTDIEDTNAGQVYSVDLRGARIRGPFKCGNGARLRSSILLKDSCITGLDFAGKPALRRTEIGGSIFAPYVQIRGPLRLDHCKIHGGIDLRYGHVEGSLEYSDQGEDETCGLLSEEDKSTWEGISLMMQGLAIDGALHLRGFQARGGANMRGFRVTGAIHADPNGTRETHFGKGRYRNREFSLRLSNSHVAGDLNLDRIHCTSAILLRSSEVLADIRLEGAKVGHGQVLTLPEKVALLLDLARVSGSVLAAKMRLSDASTVHAHSLNVGNDFIFDLEQEIHPSVYPHQSRDGYVIDLKNSIVPGKLALPAYCEIGRWLSLDGVKMGELNLTLFDGRRELPSWIVKRSGLMDRLCQHRPILRSRRQNPHYKQFLWFSISRWDAKVDGSSSTSQGGWTGWRGGTLLWDAKDWKDEDLPFNLYGITFRDFTLLSNNEWREEISRPALFSWAPVWFSQRLAWISAKLACILLGRIGYTLAISLEVAAGVILYLNAGAWFDEVVLNGVRPHWVVPGLVTIWATSYLFAIIDKRKSRPASGSEGAKRQSVLHLLPLCRFSNPLYIKFVEYYAALARREEADAIFKDLKRREIRRVNSAQRGILKTIMAFSGFGLNATPAIVVFLIAWHLGILAFSAAQPQNYIKEFKETGEAPAVQVRELNHRLSVNGLSLNVDSKLTEKPRTAYKERLKDIERRMQVGPHEEALLNTLMPLRCLFPIFKADSLGTLDPSAPVPVGEGKIPIGLVAGVLQLLGLFIIPLVVLSFAGLFRRHRHTTAIS